MDAYRRRLTSAPEGRVAVGSPHLARCRESVFNPLEKRIEQRNRDAASRAAEASRAREAAEAEARASEAAAAAASEAARCEAEAERTTREAQATGSGRRRVVAVRFHEVEGYAEQVTRAAAAKSGLASLQPTVSREKLMRTNMPLGFGAPGAAAREGRWHTSSLASGKVPPPEPEEAASSRVTLMASSVRMGTDRTDYSTSKQRQYRLTGESAVRERSGSRNALMATTMVLGRDRGTYKSSYADEYVPKGDATRDACTDRTELLKTSLVVGTDEVEYRTAHARDFVPHEGGAARRGASTDRVALLNSALRLGQDQSQWETEAKRSFAAPAREGKAAPEGSRAKLMATSMRLGQGPTDYETEAERQFRTSSEYLRRRGEAAREAAAELGPRAVPEYYYEEAAE